MNGFHAFARGALMVGLAVIALFFFKFWRRSRERLFGFFAFSFALLSITHLTFMLVGDHGEATWPYAFRVIAFAIIIAGIVDRNRAQK